MSNFPLALIQTNKQSVKQKQETNNNNKQTTGNKQNKTIKLRRESETFTCCEKKFNLTRCNCACHLFGDRFMLLKIN